MEILKWFLACPPLAQIQTLKNNIEELTEEDKKQKALLESDLEQLLEK